MTTKTRDLSDLLDANGDVKATHLDNASGTTINNNADNRLITGSGSANTLEGEANLTFDGTNLKLPDSKKIQFGTGGDMSIFHDGTNSIIAEEGGGDLYVQNNANFEILNEAGNETKAKFITDGAVELYHNNVKKIETTSGGVDITGAITVNGSALAGGVSAVKTVDITSSSTYTPTAGTKVVTVYATGGGAGAGGINQSTTVYYAYGSGGAGGAGGTGIRTYDATQLGANASITIGAGGSGGSGNATGSNGGTTTFDPAGTGTTITAYGGGGGRGIAIAHGTLSGMFGSGGGTSGAQVQIIGECGNSSDLNTASGSTVNTQANTGGASFWGGHNSTRTANGNQDHGQDASSHGAGGNGAVTKGASGSKNGGSGKAGLVVIMEYA